MGIRGKYLKKLVSSDMMSATSDIEGRHVYYIDGTYGSDGNAGTSWSESLATIQAGIDKTVPGDVVIVHPKQMAVTSTDPVDYAEVLTITTPSIALIGMSRGMAQGGLPQVKMGSGSTALLTIRAPGCLIKNMGFNGASATGGGILLDDDGGSTKSAFGTTITGCHFKNCKGSTATNAATGGAIQWAATGGAWQVKISDCRFYKCVGDIVVLGTSGSVPQDVVIEGCIFSGPAANTDCNIYTGGSGVNGIIIRDCVFTAMPAIGSGTNARYVDLTGSVGMIANCCFASLTSPTGSAGTFAAAGTLAKVPATVFITACYGETTTSE